MSSSPLSSQLSCAAMEHAQLGWISIYTDHEQVVALKFAPPKADYTPNAYSTETQRQLEAYLAGRLTEFDLNLSPHGTEFQQAVWQGLVEIPYGKTVSYAALAQHIHKPKACRAVGNANGRNPIPILIPCHRVVQADGSLGGYSQGLHRKEFLLHLENPCVWKPRNAIF